MNTKLARAAALLTAVLLAAVVWYVTRPGPPSAPGGDSNPAQGTPGSAVVPDWDPMSGSGDAGSKEPRGSANGAAANGAAANGGAPAVPAPVLPTELPPVGTEVKPGVEVSVAVPWQRIGKGRVRYEIEDLTLQRNRQTDSVEPSHWWWYPTLEVIDGDGSGAARLRVVVDRFRFRGFHPRTGFPFEFDSADPLPGMLDEPDLGRRFRPLLAILGEPAEFRTDAAGTIVDTDGLDAWRERWTTELQRIAKGSVGDAPDAPTVQSLVDRWAEWLLPRFGGGKLAGGATRPWTRTQPILAPWTLVWTGTLAVTRDDPDAFRVDISAGPQAKDAGGRGVDPSLRVRAIGVPSSYRAAYRVSRTSGALVAAQIDAKYELWQSVRKGGSEFAPEYERVFLEILRRAIVRRLSEE